MQQINQPPLRGFDPWTLGLNAQEVKIKNPNTKICRSHFHFGWNKDVILVQRFQESGG